MRLRGILLTLLLSFSFSGCSSIIGATTDKPIEPNPGERTLGTRIDDERIETIAYVNLNKVHEKLSASHISVTSYNGVVLLTGQVETKELRNLAGNTVNNINKVRQVHNELQLQGSNSFLSRSNDTWLTTKVKTKLLANKNVDGGRVKVVCENGVIYLMGLLSRDEAATATEIARNTRGVSKVVRVIEYIN